MNTQGWMRALIAKNTTSEKYIAFVTNTISKEFELPFNILKSRTGYTVKIGQYTITISGHELKWLQKKDPYALDRHILETLKTQGLEFIITRSQYTSTVFLKDI